jgi:spore germination cell wall hydrolase CwlJ-like protein
MGFKNNTNYEALIFMCFIALIPSPLNANMSNVKIDAIGQLIQNSYIPTPIISEIQIDPKELNCLSEAVYFESKNEPIDGQKAVAHVIVNRTHNSNYPNTVCKVINQKTKYTCQFSYKCDGYSDIPKNKEDFDTATDVAEDVLLGEDDITNGALFFHNNTVRPNWAKASKLTLAIGNHKFYKG